MEKINKTKTGIILPRDYGISLWSNGKKTFLSPMKYILAQLMLEKPKEIELRIKKMANEKGLVFKELNDEFKFSVLKKNTSLNILKIDSESLIKNTKKYNNTIHSQIHSMSNKFPSYYNLQLSQTNNQHSRCSCSDNYWNEIKYSGDQMCTHLSSLELALWQDLNSTKSSKNNNTGLTKRDLLQNLLLPFEFHQDHKDDYLEKLTNDALFDYFIEKKSHVNINKKLLDKPIIYSEKLRNKLESNDDCLSYQILRLKEKDFITQKLPIADKIYYNCVKALDIRLQNELKSRGYQFESYGLEFKGTEHETISKRFRNKDQIYSICMSSHQLPLLVRKNLGEKSSNLYNSNDLNCIRSSTNPNFNLNPIEREIEYMSIDDKTRRECLTKIIVPGFSGNSIVEIPNFLREIYNQTLNRFSMSFIN